MLPLLSACPLAQRAVAHQLGKKSHDPERKMLKETKKPGTRHDVSGGQEPPIQHTVFKIGLTVLAMISPRGFEFSHPIGFRFLLR